MLKKGTLIHEESPFVHVLCSNFKLFRCDTCYREGELLKCSRCSYVRYCDKGCQREGWKDHKAECENLKKLPPGRVVPNAARLISRLIRKLNAGGANEMGFYSKKTKHRFFKDLMSHYSDIKEDKKRLEHAFTLYQVLKDYMGEDNIPNSAEFLGMYGRMVVNTFTILDDEMNTVGSGIYLGASTIDHSCKPNAAATFRGTKINIRTLEDIPNFDWSKLRISYIDLLKGRQERQEELLGQYYFLCDCQKCLDFEEEKLMSSILCQNNSCSAPVATIQDEKSNDGRNLIREVFKCNTCGQKISDETRNNYLASLEFIQEQHNLMKDLAYLDICKTILNKMEGLFHPLSYYYVKTLDMAFESSIQLSHWNDSQVIGEKLINGYRRYYGDFSPLLGVFFMKLGKIYLYKDSFEKALTALQEAEKIISVTHGKTHELYKQQLAPMILEAKMEVEARA